jgi:hypothetical protein
LAIPDITSLVEVVFALEKTFFDAIMPPSRATSSPIGDGAHAMYASVEGHQPLSHVVECPALGRSTRGRIRVFQNNFNSADAPLKAPIAQKYLSAGFLTRTIKIFI